MGCEVGRTRERIKGRVWVVWCDARYDSLGERIFGVYTTQDRAHKDPHWLEEDVKGVAITTVQIDTPMYYGEPGEPQPQEGLCPEYADGWCRDAIVHLPFEDTMCPHGGIEAKCLGRKPQGEQATCQPTK